MPQLLTIRPFEWVEKNAAGEGHPYRPKEEIKSSHNAAEIRGRIFI
jgi:hypothetical protein